MIDLHYAKGITITKRRNLMVEMTDREMLAAIYGGVEQIKGDVAQLNVRVGNLESDVAELKSDVSVLKSDVTELKSDVSVLKSDVTELKSEVTELKSDVAVLKEDVAILKEDVSNLKEDMEQTKSKISGIEMTLENEIRNNIRIVAEGHTDIIRRFDDYMVIENSKEMFSVRMNILETDVRNIKEKIGIA